jgi:hypothetical protein
LITLPAALWPLGSIQPLTGMCTRNLPGGKGGRRIRLTSPPYLSRLSRTVVFNLFCSRTPHM